jgi:hypothetical protein
LRHATSAEIRRAVSVLIEKRVTVTYSPSKVRTADRPMTSQGRRVQKATTGSIMGIRSAGEGIIARAIARRLT